MLVLLQHDLLLLPAAGRELFYTLELGAVAVTAFFALSGFIVAEALTRFYDGRPAAFLANRVLRVVPPYLAVLALMVGLDGWLYGQGMLVSLDAPLQGSPLAPPMLLAGVLDIVPGFTARRVSGQDFSFIPFAWTLRVEFAFYLTAFATAVALPWCRDARGRRAVVGAALAVAYTMFAVFACFGRTQIGALQVICVPFFAFGLCVFFYVRRPGGWALAHLLVVSAGVVLAFTYWGQRGHPALAFQLPLLALLLSGLFGLARVQSGALVWDRWLGELSYPLYIGHGAVLTALASVSAHRGALPYCAAIVLSLVLAMVIHVAVERPLRGMRGWLRTGEKKAVLF